MNLAAWLIAGMALLSMGLAVALYRARSSLRESRARERERDRSLDEARHELHDFIYIASHDLQEPVRAVDGYTKLLAARYRDTLDDDARDFIDYAATGATRLTAMLHGLLEYSRVHTRGVAPTAVALAQTAADARAELGCEMELGDVEIEIDELPVVHGDPAQLKTLVRELLVNGVKHGDPSRPCRLTVRTERDDEQCRLIFEDNGIGIPPDQLETVFEPFKRLRGSGAGMGLAVCRRIATRHGGRIWAESMDVPGTRLVCTLPRAEQ